MTSVAPGAKGSTFTLALAGIVVRALKRAMIALKNRQQVSELSRLDDRALKDIGLVRTDVEAALAMPLFEDPSRHLIDVAGDKRNHAVFSAAPQDAFVSPQLFHRLRRDDAPVTPLPGKAATA